MRFLRIIPLSLLPAAYSAYLCGHHAIKAQAFALAPPDSNPITMHEAHHVVTKTIVEHASLSLHEDLKRQAATSTPLFTGHGPVQPGVSFNQQSATTPTGAVPKGASALTSSVAFSSLKTSTSTASVSVPTHSNAASLISVGSWGFGIWSVVNLVRFVI
jgi:hypothetical protein